MKAKVGILITCLFIITTVKADLLTVVEDAKLLQATRDQIKEIQTIQSKLEGQLEVLKSNQAAMTGHYKYSSLFNDSSLKDWQHAGNDWSSMLDSSTSNSESLTAIKKQIQKEFPIKNAASLYSRTDSENAKLYDLLAKTTLASRATSTLTYNNIDKELLMLEKLQQQIEESPNQKATLDLIARIQIEEAKLIAYQLKSTAVSSQLTSLQSQQEVSDAKWASDFFKWHD